MVLPVLIFHLGYPKSASTALQQACSESSEWLRGKGVTYPSSLCLGEAKHEEIFRLARIGRVKKAIKVLREELAGDEAKVIFLSTESIVNQLDNLDDSRWVELFSALKKIGRLKLLIVIREPAGLLKSYYKQAVVNQPSLAVSFYATHLALDEFSELIPVQRFLDFQRVIKKLEKLSGAPVNVFSYGPDVVSEVLAYVVGEEVEIELPRSNESLKPEEVELIRQINALGFSSAQRNAWFKVISHCCSLSSRTALTLASRANDEDLLTLDPSWMLGVSPGQNVCLGVNDDKLLGLARDVYQWLVAYQRTHKVKYLRAKNELESGRVPPSGVGSVGK